MKKEHEKFINTQERIHTGNVISCITQDIMIKTNFEV